VADLKAAPNVEIVRLSPALLDAALQLFGERHDKAWTLTDCASFCVMRERGLGDALTHDHHFEQAGYRPLLRADPPSS
jgi:predicted nucleic acid-binding protein